MSQAGGGEGTPKPSHEDWAAQAASRRQAAAARRRRQRAAEQAEREKRKEASKRKFAQWAKTKDFYERAAQALGEIDPARAEDEDRWFEVAVALAAVDRLLGIDAATAIRGAAKESGPPVKSLWNHFLAWTRDKKVPMRHVPVDKATESELSAEARELLDRTEDDPPKVTMAFVQFLPGAKGGDDAVRNRLYMRALRNTWRRAHAALDERTEATVQAAARGESAPEAAAHDLASKMSSLGMAGAETKAPEPAAEEGKAPDPAAAEGKAPDPEAAEDKEGSPATPSTPAPEAAPEGEGGGEGEAPAPREIGEEERAAIAHRTLRSLGLRRLTQWVDEDKDAKRQRAEQEKQSRVARAEKGFESWVRKMDMLAIHMPKGGPEEEEGKSGAAAAAPPRFDFSSKGVKRPQSKHKFPSSTLELMQNSGLRVVHASYGKGTDPVSIAERSSDLQQSRKLLREKGAVVKGNFRDEDGNVDVRAYKEELRKNEAARRKKEAADESARRARERYEAWYAHKQRVESALKYLGAIPSPLEVDVDAKGQEEHWRDVGRALKAVDIWLRTRWIEWAGKFRSHRAGVDAWATFRPKVTEAEMEDIRRRDSFLKLLRQRKLDLASEARCALRRAWWRRRAPELEKAAQRREQRLAAGLDAGGPGGEEEEVAVDPDDFPAQCEKEIDSGRIALTFAEFRRLLDREAVVMAEAEIAHVMRILDSGVTSGQELSALRRRQRADADSEEKSDGAPAQGAAATGGGGDIGSLRRSVRAARADKRISYAEITRFLDNPPVSSLEQWSDARRDHGVAYLRDLARPELKRRAEERKLKMGDPPETPVVERVDAGEEGDDPCTTLRLAWRVPAHSAPVAFFVVETCGAEGSAQQRAQEYSEVMRDPPSPDDADGPQGKHLLTSLQPNTSYMYRVRAFNAFGASPSTNVVLTTAPAQPNPPLATRVQPTALSLSWSKTASEEVAVRRLRRLFAQLDADGSGDVDREELLAGLRRSDELRDLVRRTPAASGAVRAMPLSRRVAQTGRRSQHGSVRAMSRTAMSVFDMIEMDDNESLSWDEFRRFFGGALAAAAAEGGRVAATPAEAETRYVLLRCLNEDDDDFVLAYTGRETRVTLTNLAPGTPYKFMVYATNRDGITSPISEDRVATTSLHPPDAPALAAGSAVADTAVALRWHGPSSAQTALLLAQRGGGGGGGSGSGSGVAASTIIARGGGDASTVLKGWVAGADTVRTRDGNKPRGLGLFGADQEGVNVERRFRELDKDGNGYVSPDELRAQLKAMGAPHDDEHVRDLFRRVDADQDGRISLAEFTAAFSSAGASYVLKRDDGTPLAPGVDPRATGPGPLRHVVYRGPAEECVVDGLRPNTLYSFSVRVVTPQAQSPLSQALRVATAPMRPTRIAFVRAAARIARVRWYMPPPPPPPSLPGMPVMSGGVSGRWAGGGASPEAVSVEAMSAARFVVEAAADGGMGARRGTLSTTATSVHASTSRRGRGAGGRAEWKTVWEGAASTAELSGLFPGCTYRVRVRALNAEGESSEPSPATVVVTASSEAEATMRPSTAERDFTLECTGNVVLADTLLFTERLYRLPAGHVVTEGGEGDPQTRHTLDFGSHGGAMTLAASATQATEAGKAKALAATAQRTRAAGTSSVAAQGAFIGERTVAATVRAVRASQQSIAQRTSAAASRASVGRGSRREGFDPTASVASAASAMSASAATGGGRRVLSLQVEWSTVSRADAEDAVLPRGVTIRRKERNLFRFEVFRAPWEEEQLRVGAEDEEERVAAMSTSLAEGGEPAGGSGDEEEEDEYSMRSSSRGRSR